MSGTWNTWTKKFYFTEVCITKIRNLYGITLNNNNFLSGMGKTEREYVSKRIVCVLKEVAAYSSIDAYEKYFVSLHDLAVVNINNKDFNTFSFVFSLCFFYGLTTFPVNVSQRAGSDGLFVRPGISKCTDELYGALCNVLERNPAFPFQRAESLGYYRRRV